CVSPLVIPLRFDWFPILARVLAQKYRTYAPGLAGPPGATLLFSTHLRASGDPSHRGFHETVAAARNVRKLRCQLPGMLDVQPFPTQRDILLSQPAHALQASEEERPCLDNGFCACDWWHLLALAFFSLMSRQ